MTIWLISDHHFGHENMYHFTRADGVTRVRPAFAHAVDADAEMIERHNAVVKPSDHVWFGGDVALTRAGLRLVKSLNGHKRLILGNHDRYPMHTYRDAGFQKITSSRVFGSRGKLIWFTHIPMHASCLGASGTLNVHGHIHERTIDDPRYLNVCVEHTAYTPLPLDSVFTWMSKLNITGGL